MHRYYLLTIICLCIVFIAGCGKRRTQEADISPKGKVIISCEEYKKIRLGQSNAELTQLIGMPGQIVIEYESEPGTELIIRCWINPDGSCLYGQYKNDKLMSVIQCGLRSQGQQTSDEKKNLMNYLITIMNLACEMYCSDTSEYPKQLSDLALPQNTPPSSLGKNKDFYKGPYLMNGVPINPLGDQSDKEIAHNWMYDSKTGEIVSAIPE